MWLSLIPEVRDVSMEKVHFTMLRSRSVLTLTSATKVNQLTFSTWLVLNTMRQDLWCGSGAWKWETRSEKPIFTSQTSGLWPKMVFIIATKWWCPGSLFDVDNTFPERNKCSIAFLDNLWSWTNSIGVDWMNLKKWKILLFFVRILSAPNQMKRLLKLPKHADAPCSFS